MINVRLTTVINRPVDEVWPYLTRAEYAAKWMTGVLEASLISDGPMGVGTRFQKVQRFFGLKTRMSYEIIDYEENTELAYRTGWRFLSYQATLTAEPARGSTKINYIGKGSLKGVFRPLEPIFARIARRRFRHDFNTLKGALEILDQPVDS